ncbi:hypothetical protein M427DRAFT_36480 [Gonapodya prolifera JEL478]|uniref:Ubiquitin-activating enzyme E1-like n=1 Tax=Gonapodya prolifera (strain JEL478) TaxID=1344416 RepID=A0A139A3B5_GONPJ|nr:hypothetical protein M427DRAFT_36480 [Gonapodya prolifera JEL478]|eukprot:KXS10873.1 hypothetical protein M427DRAFT_36480 [Gonapodya prolifera JEL478]
MTDSGRLAHLECALSADLTKTLGDASILMVGAGGIGCELLKTLLLSGVKNITVVDLDTIDLSNLNRQFLFQKQHISKAKAHVARESALRFNPEANIVSHHANIKDPQFDVAFFRGFTVVMNALDNLEARSYVNLMCLAADRPLVEAGTTGFQGQSYVIKRRKTACYDCLPKVLPKTYAVCTIRSTPSLPIHCIVWAKSYLFSQLFGPPSESEDPVLDTREDEGNAEEISKLKDESEALKAIKDAMGTDKFPRMVFEKVFNTDVNRLLSMHDMWKSRKPPTPLVYDELASEEEKETQTRKGRSKGKGKAQKNAPESGDRERLEWEQKVWSVEESVGVFLKSLRVLATRYQEVRKSDPESGLSFDKDDDPVMDFVAATANLRAHVYGIPQQCRFNTKQMAGSIIPAVATSNAIIAGVMVLHLFKLLTPSEVPLSGIKRATLGTSTGRGTILGAGSNEAPNPVCAVCNAGFVVVETDVEKAKLKDIVEIVKGSDHLGLKGEVSINHKNLLIYEDDDLEDNVDKTLQEVHITHGKNLQILVDDDDAGVKRTVYLFVLHRDNLPTLFTLSGDKGVDIPTVASRVAEESNNAKRPREEGLEERDEGTKRLRTDGGSHDDPIVIDEVEDTIELD